MKDHAAAWVKILDVNFRCDFDGITGVYRFNFITDTGRFIENSSHINHMVISLLHSKQRLASLSPRVLKKPGMYSTIYP